MQILHVTRAVDWRNAAEIGEYRWSTAGATIETVGFIHASTPDQVAATASRVYGTSSDDLVVLVLDDDQIRAAGTDVVFEDGGNGELYPHIYGPIQVEWVHDVKPGHFDASGTFTF